VVESVVRPSGPYSLMLTVRWYGDATRMVRDGTVLAAVPGGLARAWQKADGTVVLQGESEQAVERLRFSLALDDDHTPFLRRFAHDPLIGETTRRMRGLRQSRVSTVVHALLRAFCGQLIESKRARHLEARIVRAAMPEVAGSRLHAPPTAATFASLAPAGLRSQGLHARRAAALVRICRASDPERLRALPTEAAARHLERERGLGPWSAGVVCLEGLGRPERGLVGDLGLLKLVSALRGRRAEAWETEELLAPYGEWAGLASVYLLKGYGLGLVRAA
jgi:3-methyladenine DNA glycosylase/8-oxoguanine DNA glycosylase